MSVNPFHSGNAYVKLLYGDPEAVCRTGLFEFIRENEARPLQVMLSSREETLADLLLKCGFERKRRCFELSVSRGKLRDAPAPYPEMLSTRRGEDAYEACCRLLYRYYAATHEAVNPLTAPFDRFCSVLPDEAYYALYNGSVVFAAFTEEDEIAYVCFDRADGFGAFLDGVLAIMFDRFERIFFEADDTDPAAMALMDKFLRRPEITFDTYVFD